MSSHLRCQAKDNRTGELICDRKMVPPKPYCIFHNENQSLKVFKTQFLEELKHVHESKDKKYFNGKCFGFPQRINLNYVSFNKPVIFEFAKFYNEVGFRNTQFLDRAEFYGSSFGNNISFSEAIFKKGVNFGFTKFGYYADFLETQFGDKSFFDNVKFGENLIFWRAQFGNNAVFIHSEFGDNADFRETKFGECTDFTYARFSAKANFTNSKFGPKAFFNSATFGQKSSFLLADFGSKTNFQFTEFSEDVNFSKAKFGKNSSFLDAKFGDRTTFKKCNFGNQMSFENSRFAGETTFAYFILNGIINFTNVVFEIPNKVTFRNVNFDMISLVNTNVQNINFIDCSWPKIENRIAVFDEIYYINYKKIGEESFLSKPTLGEIEQLYRRLQSNYEENKCPNEAGDFYIGAMEMRRKQLALYSNPIVKWARQNIFSLLAWYHHISMYGERYTRTLIWIFFIILLFSGIYLITGFEYPKTVPITQFSIDSILKAIEISIYTFSFQRNTPFLLTRASQFLSIIETIFSAILLPLFLLSLRRRFRRE